MKPTKRAKKNQARQKLKLESAIATKEATQEDKILDNPTNIKIEIILLIITLVFTGIMIFLMGAIRMSPFADNGGPYVKAEEALIRTNSEDKGNSILEKHHAEGLKINNNSEPSNEDYQKALSFNKNLLDYFMFVDEERKKIHASNSEKTDSTPSIENKDDKEITHLLVVPAAGFETKENIFVDIVNYESDKQPSKYDTEKNLKKEMAVLWASENTEEGKLKMAAAERENQKIAKEEPNIDDLIVIIKEHGLTLAYLIYGMVALLLYSEHRKEKKRRFAYIEEDESQSEVAPTSLEINNHKDLTRYSNKL